MAKLTPLPTDLRFAVRRSSLLLFTVLFAACDSPVAPEVGVTLGRVHAGASFTCGITEEGVGLCWGYNDAGQLGTRSILASFELPPEVVSQELRFTELSTRAAGRHVCGITVPGDAYCWGENNFGQIGNASTRSLEGPQLVAGGFTFTSISAGWRSSCGVTTDGDAYCWGRGEWGQLGDGRATRSSVPTLVAGRHSFQKLDVGSNNLVCGLSTEGRIFCWGLDRAGSLGAPSTATCVRSDGLELECAKSPQPIASEERFLDVTAGSSFACGITRSLRLLCWGRNDVGQIGSRTSQTCSQRLLSGVACGPTPVPVSGTMRFVSVAAGLRHACGVTVDGVAYCWGRNSLGELGNGAVGTGSDVPVRVRGNMTFKSVSAGDQHSCGEGTDGVWYCWGANAWGQLGTGDTRLWLEPTPVVTGI